MKITVTMANGEIKKLAMTQKNIEILLSTEEGIVFICQLLSGNVIIRR